MWVKEWRDIKGLACKQISDHVACPMEPELAEMKITDCTRHTVATAETRFI